MKYSSGADVRVAMSGVSRVRIGIVSVTAKVLATDEVPSLYSEDDGL